MRTLRKNKQPLYYANLIEEVDEYEVDEEGHLVVDYVDTETGVTHYVTTGRSILLYADPIEFDANISFSGGEIVTQEYGVDKSNYDASVVYDLNKYPITETSLIWFQHQPTFIGEGVMRRVDPDSADYKVVKVKPSLNYTKVLLTERVK